MNREILKRFLFLLTFKSTIMSEERDVNNFTTEERKGKRLKRKFLGNVPAKNAFEHAHLKAYLKGSKIFNFGFKNKIAVQHKVQQKYYLV